MKKLTFALIFLVFFGGFLFAQQLPKITIVNNTGYPVYMVFASPNVDEDWGEDLLGDRMLEDGQSADITLLLPLSRVNLYDIMLVDTDDDTYSKFAVKITNNMKVVFTFDDFD